jgi:lipopolysaccharide transport protein LptA
MKTLLMLVLFVTIGAAGRLQSQSPVASAPKTSATTAPEKKAKKTASEKKAAGQKQDKSPAENLFGTGLQSNEPTTTEIYADEAFFDSTKNMGIFSGRVKVIDPRFNLQSDKLTVFITKGQNQSLEKAIADGNVGLVRQRPNPSGGPPTLAIGRADKATYIAATGDVELRGTPRVQEGLNMHVATSPDTVMVINQNSQLTTHGPSRTEIRQQPGEQKKATATPAQTSPAPAATAQTPPAQTSPAQTPPTAALPKP